MTLEEIKNWIESLPAEFLKFEVVNSEEGELKGTDNTYRLDKPIIALSVDEENKEILFLNK